MVVYFLETSYLILGRMTENNTPLSNILAKLALRAGSFYAFAFRLRYAFTCGLKWLISCVCVKDALAMRQRLNHYTKWPRSELKCIPNGNA